MKSDPSNSAEGVHLWASVRALPRKLEPTTIRANIVVVVLAFALPLVLSSMYFLVNGIDKDIEFARMEGYGNAYQRPLERLLEDVAAHEHVAASYPAGAETRKKLERQIDGHWGELATVQERFGRALQFTDVGLAKRSRGHLKIAVVEGEWRSLRAASGLSPAESASRHAHIGGDLREMIGHSGDTSGLILDPDLDSYYLMDATLLALPQTQQRLAILASRLRNLPGSGILSPRTRTQLAVASSFLRESDQDRITGDVKTSINEDDGFSGRSESLHRNLPPATKQYVAESRSMIALIQRTLDSNDGSYLPAIAAAADRAQRASFALWWVAEPELDQLLANRIAYCERSKALGIFLMAIAVLLPGFFAFLMIRRITRPITGLSDVARRISVEKDYSVRAPAGAGGETGALIASFNDMLSRIESHELLRRSTEGLLRESEERYAIAAHGANDGLWDWKLTTNEIYFSPRWNEMLGYPSGHSWADPEDWFQAIHHSDQERVRIELAAHLEGTKPEFSSEYRMGHKKGGFIWMLSRGIAVREASGAAVRIAGSHTDITEGKIADPLTGLPNRLYFIDRLENSIAAAQQRGGLFAVLFLDLDKFKSVNDGLGHKVGDELLMGVSRRLSESVQAARISQGGAKSFVVARLGGDEFAVLLTDIKEDQDAAAVAGSILVSLATPFMIEGRTVFATASIGIALNSSADTPEELLRNADTAMYHAKGKGKARYEMFDEGMRARAVERLETESHLRKGIADGQLLLYYQPQISVNDNRVIGYEALVRWIHPERGLLSPDQFIPIAEESDLIIVLGRWVLREACRQMAEWQKNFPMDPPLSVSVNIAPKQLVNAHLIEDLENILAETGLNPRSLKLEMTESSIMQDPEAAIVTMRRLKLMNIGLEIDDFGTGYSSLSYLQRFPFDTVKIDRCFINEMGASTEDARIVSTIMQLAHSLNMQVVAEGVENASQMRNLSALGCDNVQGFLFSKPVSSQATEVLLKERSDIQRAFRLLSAPFSNAPADEDLADGAKPNLLVTQ